MNFTKEQFIWVLLRLTLGWMFLWAFLDKLFGLGFATLYSKAWIVGGSPTFGFLKFATHGPLAPFYQSIAGSGVVAWLFMIGLLMLGLSLILGIGVRLASYAGILLFTLMYSAALPPVNNPILDEHIVYIIIMIGFAAVNPGQWFGFGKWWNNTALVRKIPLLK